MEDPDIAAVISFLPTTVGGRKIPHYSGFRPVHDFGLPGVLIVAQHDYVDQKEVRPGQSARAHLEFLVPEYLEAMLYPGFQFSIFEGSHLVAHGVVTDVVNPLLRRRTAGEQG